MLKKLAISLTQIIKTVIAILITHKTVLRTFAMTGKLPLALTALLWQTIVLKTRESFLVLTIHHLCYCLVLYVAKQVFGIYKMVARVYISVKLHHSCMTTLLGKSTQSRLNTNPIGKRCIEYLYIILTNIITYPLVKDGAKEVAPLFGSNREVYKLASLLHTRSKRQSVITAYLSLYDRCKLYVMATYFLKEVIEIEWIVGIKIVYHSKRIPFYSVLV